MAAFAVFAWYVAKMLSDGTIHLELRPQLPGGGEAMGSIDYKPSDLNYREVLAHIGGLQPGETKLVRPWPDPPAPQR
jgi:hypothetical protein